ncbi:MAG: hypothetical protein ACR2MM_02765, partial [Flavobacteriaceae bacterium]
MDGRVSQIITWLGVLISKIKGRTFRPYVHPVKEIRKIFASHGYVRMSHKLAFPWHVETYRRIRVNLPTSPESGSTNPA